MTAAGQGKSMMRKLDKSSLYGEVHGGGPAVYEQAGVLFDCHGREIGEDWRPPAPIVTVAPPLEAAEGPPIDEVVAMAREGKTPVEIGRTLGVHVAKVKAILKRAL